VFAVIVEGMLLDTDALRSCRFAVVVWGIGIIFIDCCTDWSTSRLHFTTIWQKGNFSTCAAKVQ